MFKFGVRAGVLAATFVAVSPANAVLMDAIKVTSSNGDYLQIAELQAFSNGVNVALASNGGVATAYSSLFGFTGPNKVNDGLTDGQPYGGGVYISGGNSAAEYLLVTFDHTYDISGVRMFGREDCCQQRDIFTYVLFNQGQPAGTNSMNISGQGNGNHNLANFGALMPNGRIAVVPEPATWGLMLVGFGGIGYAMRRSRKVAVSFL